MADIFQNSLFAGGGEKAENPAYLFFDTETTGLPRSWNAPATDLSNWPRVVQLAWLVFDDRGKEISRGNKIIRPEGFEIPEEASRIHGITTERALREGHVLADILAQFRGDVDATHSVVAHNLDFDEKIIGAEFLRKGMPHEFSGKNKIDTMLSSVDFCAIPSPRGTGYKWPRLSELHKKLFGAEFADAHDALADIQATAKCFWELKKRGIV